MLNTLLTNVTVSAEKNSIIFGPINSRRFGMSLGIDLSPSFKQCNFDCLYCELAPSATVDMQKESLSVETVMQALKEHFNEHVDVITLTANGEPTLYPHLNKLIDAIDTIKKKAKTLILTNSATLIDEDVFHALLKLDQVKLSLDAVSSTIFKKIDRPHREIDVDQIVERVIAFSKQYKGKLFIEILFVHELNDTPQEIDKLNEVLLKIDATRVDIGSIDRPPAYPVVGISYKELREISLAFDSSLPIHIASRVHAEPNNAHYSNEEIINTLDKRPLTMEDIDLLFDDDSKKRVQTLQKEGSIVIKKRENLEFFVPKENSQRKRKK